MKRQRLVLLAVLTICLLMIVGCGKNDEKANGTPDTEGSEKKSLKVATDAAYAPFEYLDKGVVTGFDVDFVTAVMEEAGYEFEIKHVGWDPLFVELKAGRSDVGMSAITINDERKETYDFSVPYFLSTNKILVPEGSDIKSGKDLEGKKIAVQGGTTGQEAVEALLGKNNENIKKFKNNVLAIMELNSGGVDAVVADNTVVEEYAKNNPNQKLIVVEDSSSFENEYYGLMFPKGSKIAEDVNKAINAIYENGKYSEIYNTWFGTDPDIDDLKAQQKK